MTNLLPEIKTWDAWAQIFTDINIWRPAVREICRETSILLDQIKVGYPGTNAVFIINDCFVIKIYAPFCHKDFYLERTILAELVKNTLIPVPRIFAQGILEDRISWPYILMEYLPGYPLRKVREEIPHPDLIDIAKQMGVIVRILHKTPLSLFKNLDNPRFVWLNSIQHQWNIVKEKLQHKRVLPEFVIQAVPDFLTSELDMHTGEISKRLSLVHNDLTEDHWLLQKKDNHWMISALIDFADARITSPAYEFPTLSLCALGGDRDCLKALIHSYDAHLAIDESFYRLLMAYTFLHEFGAEILEYVLPSQARNNITSIKQLIELLWAKDD